MTYVKKTRESGFFFDSDVFQGWVVVVAALSRPLWSPAMGRLKPGSGVVRCRARRLGRG